MDKNNAECSRGLEQNISTCCGNESAENTPRVVEKRTNQTNMSLISPSASIMLNENRKSVKQTTSSCCYSPDDNIISSDNSFPVMISNLSGTVITRSLILVQQPHIVSNLTSPTSLVGNQPQSLFLQAFAKLNQSSLNVGVTNHFLNIQRGSYSADQTNVVYMKEVPPPDSLVNAPPTYSFVLRQIAARRRPRIFGTFIPSASFIPHTPPPHYAAAFDVYVDRSMPPLPPRINNFGFTPMPVVCPSCGYTGMSVVMSKITVCTHLCAFCLCVLCCWACAPLPYILRSCKDVYHYCRNCRQFLGMYCPTNPENSFS